MSRRRRQTMSSVALCELEVLDRVLRGEPTGGEHARLAELAVEIQALRPKPSEALLTRLDASAARGFTARMPPVRKPRRLRAAVRHPAFVAGVLAALAIAVVLPLTLSGTGNRAGERRPADGATFPSPPKTPYAKGVQAAPSASAAIPVPLRGPSQSAAPSGPRQVERTASLDIGVSPASINSTAQRVFTIASGLHGYVEQSTVNSGQGEQGGASFALRVPSTNLSGTIAALTNLGRVRSETNTTNDVTGELDGTRRALDDAQAERTSLLSRLAKAAGSPQAQTFTTRLRTIEARISHLQATLRALTGRVTYTEVALSLTPENEKEPDAALSPGGALNAAGGILTTALAILVLAASAVLPLVLLAAVIAAVLALTRRRARERALDGG